MKLIKLIAAAALGLGLAACNGTEPAMRNVPFQDATLGEATAQVAVRDYDVQSVNMTVPSTLRVSEGNSYYPFADIVWRGDPIGDRYQQIGDMFMEASRRNDPRFDGILPVDVDLELVRFHGVTERTRFSVGGNYHIVFQITVRNALTGALMEAPRIVEGNLSAPGGVAALIAEQRGQTEKVRVTDFLTQLLWDELNGPVAVGTQV